MDSYWQELRFLRSKSLKSGLGKAARVAASLGLIFTMVGPNTFVGPATPAYADALEWKYTRGPLTDDSVSVGVAGFTYLKEYGNVVHPIAVAGNSDIFTAGATAGGATGDPTIFKSSDGGLRWRMATDTLPAGSLVRSIAVSPDYPSDNVILAVFSDLDGTASEAGDGLLISTNGGSTFTLAFDGTTVGADADILAENEWRTITLSPDFNYTDGSGSLSIGGVIVATNGAGELGSVYRASAGAFKAAMAAEATWVALTSTAPAAEAVGSSTLHLAYAHDAGGETTGLGRLYTAGGATYGQVTTGDVFDNSRGGEIGSSIVATFGEVAFDNVYEGATSGFYAAVGNASSIDAFGGVYKYSGTWSRETADEGDCNVDMASLYVTGNGNDARIIATESAGNTICRSTNGASTFTDNEFDGGDDIVAAANVLAGVVMVAGNPSTPNTVYLTSAGNLGGLSKSTNGGTGWMDTGLTNQPYVVTSVTEITDKIVFATATTPVTSGCTATTPNATGGCSRALFWSDSYGTSSGWQRVDRTPDMDGLEDGGSVDGVFYLTRVGEGEERLLKSTDSGKNFRATSTDAFDDSPISGISTRSATTIYMGTDDGFVWYTTDGGGSWSMLANDFGQDIDEFDFISPSVFIVTAEHTDNTNKLWLTKDSGATFTQLGDAPWGTGDGTITTTVAGYSAAGDAGYITVQTSGDSTTDDVWRLKAGTNVFVELENMDVAWSSLGRVAVAGVGEGAMYYFWKNGTVAPFGLYLSFYVTTGLYDKFNADDATDNERENLLLSIPGPIGAAGTMGTSKVASGEFTFQNTVAGQIQEMTLIKGFRDGIKTSSPANNGSVSSNIGDNGTPAILRWDNVSDAGTYEVMMGYDPKLSDGTIIGTLPLGANPTTNLLTVDDAQFPLVQGNTYYWQVRVKSAKVSTCATQCFEGPWSAISSFSVGGSSGVGSVPAAQLPLNDTTAPNVGPIEFSFNLPAGTSQFHIQITPLNNDGPAINTIVGDPAQVALGSYTALPPVMGANNYTLLPGATYTWRVRATAKTGNVAATDGSWGQWSDIRTIKTPRPNPGTITLQTVGTGNVTTDTTPTLAWKDSNVNAFYYEVQLSADPSFNANPATAVAAVYWNLVHGGVSTPLSSWTVPDGAALAKGRYFWRARHRVQASPLGADEPGTGWTLATTITIN